MKKVHYQIENVLRFAHIRVSLFFIKRSEKMLKKMECSVQEIEHQRMCLRFPLEKHTIRWLSAYKSMYTEQNTEFYKIRREICRGDMVRIGGLALNAKTWMHSYLVGIEVKIWSEPSWPSFTSLLYVCEEWMFWRDCATAQARLSLRCSPMKSNAKISSKMFSI